MKKLIIFAALGVVLLLMIPRYKSLLLFNPAEQDYITNMANLTTTADLQEFFEAQSSIYVDNVYGMYQNFFRKLLPKFSKSLRSEQIQHFLEEIETFLVIDDVHKKMKTFDSFTHQSPLLQETIFEYDAEETKMSSTQFNSAYVEHGADEILNYANDTQMRGFVENTGTGIRIFLITHRTGLDKTAIMEFKTVVDQFLERESFIEKWYCLKLFLHTSQKYLP